MTYAITKLATFKTPDGGGFNATLACNGRKVAEIFDAGMGGCYIYDFIHRADETAFQEYVAGQPDYDSGHYTLAMDSLAALLVDDFDFRKRVLRKVKAGFVFTHNGTLRGFKRGASRAGADKALDSLTGDVVKLYDMNDNEAFAAYCAAQEAEA